MNIHTCQPIQGRPTDAELADVEALPDIPVTMTTYVGRDGQPVWLLERFTDPTNGLPKEVWSRVTTSLAYVRV